MARLRAQCKGLTDGRQQGWAHRLGEQMVEASVNSQDTANKDKEVTKATLRLFEDGSGLFQFKRGQEDIAIRWTEEENPVFEMHANFGGVEGTLVPSNLPVAVPEANDGN